MAKPLSYRDYARSAKTFWAAPSDAPKSTGWPSSWSTCAVLLPSPR